MFIMFKRIYSGPIPMLILGSALLLGSISQSVIAQSLKLSNEQQQAMGIQFQQAENVKVVPSAVFPAQATIPLKTIRSLASPLSGQIVKLNYVHGPIKKGDIIAEMESPELLQLQEEFLATLSDLSISQQNLDRARKLNQSGISSTKKLQQALTDVKKLILKEIQLKQKLALYGMAESAIEKMEQKKKLQPAILQLKSPIDGQLFDLKVRLGERVEKNQSIISLGETNPIILAVRVPVSMVNELTKGQQVEILGMHKTGEIQHIDLMVDPMTQSVDVHVQVQNDDNTLRAGQLFKIRFLMTPNQATFKINSNAISQFDGKTVVFIQDSKAIKPLPVKVINITNQQLYFTPAANYSKPLMVCVQGSTAIKSAFEAQSGSEAE